MTPAQSPPLQCTGLKMDISQQCALWNKSIKDNTLGNQGNSSELHANRASSAAGKQGKFGARTVFTGKQGRAGQAPSYRQIGQNKASSELQTDRAEQDGYRATAKQCKFRARTLSTVQTVQSEHFLVEGLRNWHIGSKSAISHFCELLGFLQVIPPGCCFHSVQYLLT